MAAQTLSFTKVGEAYQAKYTSTGDTVVQLERVSNGKLAVFANIEGMTPKSLSMPSVNEYNAGQIVLFKVCVPAGMTVTIESTSEVTTGKTLTEDA